MAYSAIADLEPSNIYTWSIIDNDGKQINVLAGGEYLKGLRAFNRPNDMKR